MPPEEGTRSCGASAAGIVLARATFSTAAASAAAQAARAGDVARSVEPESVESLIALDACATERMDSGLD